MTLNEISRKLIKNNLKQYGLFFFSVLFSITMIGAYGILQYSPTVTNVLIDGGSTQTISQSMFFGSMLGIIVFLIYADTLFLKYKSREIGVFLSLGIDRYFVQKIVIKEYTFLFVIAVILGIVLSAPLAFLCWSLLNLFLKTGETDFTIGWAGIVIAICFSVISWVILRFVNRRYIKSVDILRILKTSDENEEAENGSLVKLILGFLMIPVGIIAFFTLQNMDGIQNTILGLAGLVAAIYGVYVVVIQLASIGDILKKRNKRAYYKNIVFYNLLKQKIRQYTQSIFVATLLITFTIFGIGFISAGFVDGYNVALNEPFDYTINASFEQPNITEDYIRKTAEETGTKITELKELNGVLIGVQNSYRNGDTDWSTRIIVSNHNFNIIAGTNLSVPKGTYTLYYNSSMSYKLNAFYADSNAFYNPTTKEEFYLSKNEPVCFDGLVNSRSFFSSFLILNDNDFEDISKSIGEKYAAISYMVNVDNWENTVKFQDTILRDVIKESNGKIFTNWHNSAIFDKTANEPEYLNFDGNETRVARVWALYPLSKLSSATIQFEAFATYLMLMLFIAIVAFVSSIMVIGLKLLSTIWNDAPVYSNLERLGMKQNGIKKIITKQMLFIYFIPTILGCLIGSFTTYRIMLVSAVIYIKETMFLVGWLCVLVFILQLIIFVVLRHKITKNYANR